MLLLVVLHFLPLSNLFPESKVKGAKLKLSCTMLGLGVEQYSLLILLIEYQVENKKGEMYSKNFFEVAGNLLQMNCQLRDAVDVNKNYIDSSQRQGKLVATFMQNIQV